MFVSLKQLQLHLVTYLLALTLSDHTTDPHCVIWNHINHNLVPTVLLMPQKYLNADDDAEGFCSLPEFCPTLDSFESPSINHD
mmetsp:Transcript_124673/g.216149  ORF Transcript_124673/g.216149 Transcript_124673/m.216149 type:complete len:83 (-) Transcript_124673:477-725(-)